MLRRFHIARLALKHSPETEQRLLSFAAGSSVPTPQNPDDSEMHAERGVEANELKIIDPRTESILEQTLKFRKDLFGATSVDQSRDFLREHRQELTSSVQKETDIEERSDEEVGYILSFVRSKASTEIAREKDLGQKISQIDESGDITSQFEGMRSDIEEICARYEIHADNDKMLLTKLQALFHEDVLQRSLQTEREYREKNMKGATWSFLNAEDFAERHGNSSDRLPSAFVENGKMYFNTDHPSFRESENADAYMERSVAHEVMHVTLAQNGDRENRIINAFKQSPLWMELSLAVTEFVGQEERDAMAGEQKDRWIVHEALAISAGNAASPLSRVGASTAEVASIEHQNRVSGIVSRLTKSILDASQKHDVDELLAEAQRNRVQKRWNPETQKLEEVRISDLLRESVKDGALRQKMAKEDRAEVDAYKFNNSAEFKDLAGRVEADAEAKKAGNEKMESLNAQMEESRKDIDRYFSSESTIRGYINKSFTGSERNEQIQAVEAIKEELSGYRNDLNIMGRYLAVLARWPEASVAEKKAIGDLFPINPYAQLTEESSPEDIATADLSSQEYRATLLECISGTSARIAGAVELQKKTLEKIDLANTMNQTSEEEAKTAWGWMKQNLFSSTGEGYVMWVTPRNMMKIYSIFKDAIVENYVNNQSLKEYNLAKRLNFYQPIEHTLKKQAKSANEKETGEFKEYIEREGFTFDEIFGPDGKGLSSGLLHENRHNFNRAKAVLLYAAEHAWLYHMNRFNGHDVYGVDYETVEGHRSFEELVQMYEKGKESEEDHGYQKVDKHPDIPMMIKDMRHELHLKNIFAVRGILKRIQEKAKYGEANAWAAAEVVRAMRDPSIMAVMDKGFLDDVGNIGIGQSAWTLTLFKLMRHDFEDFRTKKNKSLEQNNVFVQAIARAESLLVDAGISPNNDDLSEGMDRYIGRIMAGQTVAIGDKRISIFQDYKEFNEYRSFWATTATSTEPGKTDDDYFNPGNLGSDLLMLPKTSISAILVRTSQGQWTHTTRAPNYMAQVIFRDIDLGKNDPAAQQTFRKEMGQRLSYFFSEAVSHPATAQNLGDDTTPTTKNLEISDKNIIMELWQRKMLSEETFLALVSGQQKDEAMPPALKAIRKQQKAIDKLKAAQPVDDAKVKAAEAELKRVIEVARGSPTDPSAAAVGSLAAAA